MEKTPMLRPQHIECPISDNGQKQDWVISVREDVFQVSLLEI